MPTIYTKTEHMSVLISLPGKKGSEDALVLWLT